ncbi:nuclear transport factor 2 family protein [Streptomyces sp. NBC_01264]|uniref:nuclear transport factor 2 family protein n=1 Tax=Streptomyces sp. NBC_01264 TaxID=2903804 RepID=UPI0022518A77|nr:nuclear transport factor 2 family protein [Streptomyces sp. NBC_01264]MCX4783614.1 nuclear transport factor 2 family protein [Streptomyces sp. NBC_01264]
MTSTDPATVFQAYYESLVGGDMERLGGLLADDIVWHQPGAGALSGIHRGRDAVLALFGEFMGRSHGTFRLVVREVMVNGPLVAATVDFTADRPDRAPLGMSGVDLMRIEEDRITEVWLFSQDQAAEDLFWGLDQG